jgi:hypothetical protein
MKKWFILQDIFHRILVISSLSKIFTILFFAGIGSVRLNRFGIICDATNVEGLNNPCVFSMRQLVQIRA